MFVFFLKTALQFVTLHLHVNVDSFFVLVSFYRFIDNALSGKESSVLEKVR